MLNENTDEIDELRQRVELLELNVKAINMEKELRYLKRCNPDKAGGVERELVELQRQIASKSET